MLVELKVSNLALIRALTLSFGPGANILTGETGAGKSILVGAIGLLRGAKTSGDLVRAGESEARVEALFQLERPGDLAPLLAECGLEPADELVVQRVVGANGRSKIRLNGSLITQAQLAALGEELLAVSGQHDQQSLVREARQLDFLDAYGGHRDLLSAMAAAHKERESRAAAIAELRGEIASGEERRELMEYQLREIDRAAPREGEDQELADLRANAKSSGRLAKTLGEAQEVIQGQRGESLGRKLDRLETLLGRASQSDERLAPLAESARECSAAIADLAESLFKLGRNLGPGPEELEDVEERLSLLAKLKRKYGPGLEEVIEKATANRDALARLESAAFELKNLGKLLAAAVAEAEKIALELRSAREKAALKLTGNLVATLGVLGFPKLTMKIEILPLEKDGLSAGEAAGPKGADQVAFLFCPNPGEGLKPLAKIASGGELSRMMLALKIAQEPRSDQSLVFDEIDSGLSGATAEAVASKMAELSANQQILVITHLPQMASMAGRHFLAAKSPDQSGGRTESSITELDPELRALELARMLDGATPSEEAMALSRRLLQEAGAR
ncbi:MAG: DNA repair protein RecN [Deltaproteobacteria bacterium]|jgi:DNA repair protein RecN (Recombination protein N)|nr:DNA repair protein RecN [Deltaproteobacteria bacterium]